ncbi:hypothetical protein DVH05_024180 [Phytophthora capsici]|nr:hypothetical protein DVH05_024180 [Phytophthora capsici]
MNDAMLLRVWGILDDSAGPGTDLATNSEAVSDAETPGSNGEDSTRLEEGSDSELLTQNDSIDGRRRIYTNAFKLRIIGLVTAGTCIAQLAHANDIKCSQSIHAWIERSDEIKTACEEDKRSKVTVGGQGRPELFPHSDAVVQWIKEMRRENFPLKTSHVVAFLDEEVSSWAVAYRASRHRRASFGLCNASSSATVSPFAGPTALY